MESLYQTQLLALAKFARDFPPLPSYTHQAMINNPVCGDRVIARLTVKGNVITACTADVKGCALCEAGAGLLLECAPKGQLTETTALVTQLNAFLTSDVDNKSQAGDDKASRFEAFAPVKGIKNRHQCVLLAFDTFNEAVNSLRADGDLVKGP